MKSNLLKYMMLHNVYIQCNSLCLNSFVLRSILYSIKISNMKIISTDEIERRFGYEPKRRLAPYFALIREKWDYWTIQWALLYIADLDMLIYSMHTITVLKSQSPFFVTAKTTLPVREFFPINYNFLEEVL
jgi:hypothetical protein